MENRESRALAFLFGAGASARFNYPTVTNFFDQCKHQGFPHDECEDLWRYIRLLESRSPNEKYPKINAEAVFSLAEQILQVDAALRIDAYPSTLPRRTKLPVLRSGVGAPDLYKRLTDGIITVYGKMPEEGPADSDPLAELIKEADDLVPHGEPVWLFTTNYDTVIEDSLRRWRDEAEGAFRHLRLEIGFALQQPHPFTPDRFEAAPGEGERILNVVKLHGSVTWKRETTEPGSRIIDSGLRVPTGHDCVLYFGYKRFPEEEPFVTLYRLFKRALLRPLTLITIGFQFADPYLRELLDFGLDANSELRVVCCLRSEPTERSAVEGLKSSHAGRFELLRDAQGKLVPFADKGFCAALKARLGA